MRTPTRVDGGVGAEMTDVTDERTWSSDHNQLFWKDLPDSSQRYRWLDIGHVPRELFHRIRGGCSCRAAPADEWSRQPPARAGADGDGRRPP